MDLIAHQRSVERPWISTPARRPWIIGAGAAFPAGSFVTAALYFGERGMERTGMAIATVLDCLCIGRL